MRRALLYIAAWLAAGVGAVTLATVGVSMVGNQVTGSRPAPLSADDVRTELDGDSTTTTTTALGADPASTVPPAGAADDGDGSVTPSTVRPGSAPRPTPHDAPTPTPTPTTTTTVSSIPTTTVPPASTAETRTYTLVGGTATLRFSPEGVTVVVASPNSGYSVDVEPTHGNGVQVDFRSDSHRSKVEGWWDGGPVDEVDEEAED